MIADAPPDRADPGISQRIEEASLNAWPALQQVLLDGWVLRFSGGFTKRANSIIPLYPSRQDPAGKIRYCEDLYTQHQLKTIFRLTTVNDYSGLDEQLAARGYRQLDPTAVLQRELSGKPGPESGFSTVSLADWLQVYASLAGMPKPTQALHAALLKGIRTHCIYGVLRVDGAPAACGLAVVERELLGLFDIVTHSAQRRRGFAAALVSGLLEAGQSAGAARAYLQVVKDNAPAQALYAALGFQASYDYWYRAAP